MAVEMEHEAFRNAKSTNLYKAALLKRVRLHSDPCGQTGEQLHKTAVSVLCVFVTIHRCHVAYSVRQRCLFCPLLL